MVTDTLISYMPPTDLPDTLHTVYLYIEDKAGNSADTTWSFSISTGNTTQIHAYPNPADKVEGQSSIVFGGLSSGMELIIYDINGTLLKQETVSGISYVWDIRDKSPGMYIYVIKNEDGSIIRGTIGIKE